MRVIEPKSILIPSEGTPYEIIERIGRICYKSTDKITEGSAVKFVKGLVKNKHYAMLEHYWVHFRYTGSVEKLLDNIDMVTKYFFHQYGSVIDITKFMQVTVTSVSVLVSAPLRVFVEFNDLCEKHNYNDCYGIATPISDIMYEIGKEFPELINADNWYVKGNITQCQILSEDAICDCVSKEVNMLAQREVMKHRIHTVLFICDRGVSHEFVRHRVASFAQESTRYCNYSKDGFGGEITFIKPCYLEEDSYEYCIWLSSMLHAEFSYLESLKSFLTPEQARAVLPNSLKTELIITANETEWQHIIDLRYLGTTGAPHPQMKESMGLIVDELKAVSDGRLHV